MEEFSFPTIATEQESLCPLPFPHFAASSLWFVPEQRRTRFSSAQGTHLAKDLEVNSPTTALCDDGGDGFIKDEEKMDMLWEDFNEELCPVGLDKNGGIVAKKLKEEGDSDESDIEQHGAVELCCLQALGISKGHHRRPSLLVMVKVLKKLFMIQKQSSSKTSHCHI